MANKVQIANLEFQTALRVVRDALAFERHVGHLVDQPPSMENAGIWRNISFAIPTAKTDDYTYTGDMYHDGLDQPATETGVTIKYRYAGLALTLGSAVLVTLFPWAEVFAWTVISLAGGAVAPVLLTAKIDNTTYAGDVYANGSDVAATESGVTIRVRDMASGETLPFTRWFSAVQQLWAGVSVWTLVEVPRLL